MSSLRDFLFLPHEHRWNPNQGMRSWSYFLGNFLLPASIARTQDHPQLSNHPMFVLGTQAEPFFSCWHAYQTFKTTIHLPILSKPSRWHPVQTLPPPKAFSPSKTNLLQARDFQLVTPIPIHTWAAAPTPIKALIRTFKPLFSILFFRY